MDTESNSKNSGEDTKSSSMLKIIITRLLIPAMITLVGVLIALTLIKTKPVTQTAPPHRTARLVETMEITPTSFQVQIEAMGLVEAKNRIDLKARVNGEILFVSDEVLPGNTCNKGTVLFKVDPRDYELSMSSQEANVQQAEANLMLEKGQQQIAETDYQMTDSELNGKELDLVLRKPQLLQAEASAKSALAALDSAKLNLSRTEIRAPFDALIIEKQASLGSIINTSSNLATLVESSEFWVELTIPVKDTQWIGIDKSSTDNPIQVEIIDQLAWGENQKRLGHVVGLSREVDSESRMAKVVVSVKDPLSLEESHTGQPALLLGSFVRGIIQGKELSDVLVVERSHLRQGDIIWTVDEKSRLEFNPVQVLYRGTENVVIKNKFKSAIRLVTSNLSVPVEGMLVRYEGGPEKASPPSPTGKREKPAPKQ